MLRRPGARLAVSGVDPLTANERDGLHQRQHFHHVVAVRLRDMDRKGNPLGLSDELMFCPLFRRSVGFGPVFAPSVALTEELSIATRLKSIVALS
jgi:hypothetical protein